jgi:predicted nucleic acid-binding protein
MGDAPIMKLLLDTNILIDYHLRRQPFFNDLAKLIIAGAFGDVELWTSAKSYTDVFYVAGKFVDRKALQEAFLKSFELFNVCSIDFDDLSRAAGLSWSDFEDCLISVAAEKIKADFIITRNTVGFKESNIPACSTSEILQLLETERGLRYESVAL